MKNSFKKTYEQEINKIKNDQNVISIMLVGSSKFKNLEKDNINDIDLFILTKAGDKQIREEKIINGLEFDINYFSLNVANELIINKEYFFLKEMKDPQVIYGECEEVINLIKGCKVAYDNGPDEKSEEEINTIRQKIYGDICKLKEKCNYEEIEYVFLTNLYLKDIMKVYFIKNNKWVPKDKKLIKIIKEEDTHLLNLIRRVYNSYSYNDIIDVYSYIFLEKHR